MSDLVQASLFDYSALAPEDALELRASAERIRLRLKRSAEDIIEIGQELRQAQKRLANRHGGTFLEWIAVEFGMSDQTAYNLMNVAEHFAPDSKLFGNTTPTALYLLAAPTTPQEVRDAVESGAVAPTAKAIKAAKEAVKKAQAEKTAAVAQAQEQITALETEIANLREQLIEQPERVEVIPDAVTQQITNLEAELAKQKKAYRELGERTEQISNDLKAQMARNAEEEMHNAVRNRWFATSGELLSATRKALGSLPSAVDAQSFQASDWQRLDEVETAVMQLLAQLGRLHADTFAVVDAVV